MKDIKSTEPKNEFGGVAAVSLDARMMQEMIRDIHGEDNIYEKTKTENPYDVCVETSDENVYKTCEERMKGVFDSTQQTALEILKGLQTGNPVNEFFDILRMDVRREGITELMDFLKNKSDFTTAPASTKYHGAFVGGLLEHSLHVYYCLCNELKHTFGEQWTAFFSKESVAIVSLLHDLCKVDMYKSQMRNVKVDGEWTQEQVFVYDTDAFAMGHATKTLHLIQKFIKLTDVEAQAIYWHMGAFDLSQYSTAQGIGNAFTNNQLAFLLHIADMKATYLMENTEFLNRMKVLEDMRPVEMDADEAHGWRYYGAEC